MKFYKSYILLFVLIISVKSIMGQKIFEYQLDSVVFDVYCELNKKWNNDGFWGKAELEQDNRYNEAIIYYAFVQKKYNITTTPIIRKAIRYSFNNLRTKNGAFVQKGKESYIRTIMFLRGLAYCFDQDSLFLEEYNDKIKESLIWINNYERPYTGNQGLAALTTFYLWQKIDTFYNSFYINQRKKVIDDFIEIDSISGFWPEGPRHWKINVPYIQVQSIFLSEYLIHNPNDKEFVELLRKIKKTLINLYDFDSMTINVEQSVGHYKENGINELPVTIASIFFLWDYILNEDKMFNNEILLKTYKNFKERFNISYYTDAYIRFGLINDIIKSEEGFK